jgi:hypothetical protein|tara:strand:+ start:598 stop:879 length:282 start_codon:yes stop_codon:yes gene_type:complete
MPSELPLLHIVEAMSRLNGLGNERRCSGDLLMKFVVHDSAPDLSLKKLRRCQQRIAPIIYLTIRAWVILIELFFSRLPIYKSFGFMSKLQFAT